MKRATTYVVSVLPRYIGVCIVLPSTSLRLALFCGLCGVVGRATCCFYGIYSNACVFGIYSNAAVLFASQHGRRFRQELLNPRISFFGCISSKDLAYSTWQYQDLLYFTNNQCGNVHIYTNSDPVEAFIENEAYARDYTTYNTYQHDEYWFLCRV